MFDLRILVALFAIGWGNTALWKSMRERDGMAVIEAILLLGVSGALIVTVLGLDR